MDKSMIGIREIDPVQREFHQVVDAVLESIEMVNGGVGIVGYVCNVKAMLANGLG